MLANRKIPRWANARWKWPLFTLRKMAAGGMHDHLGGGFHRYSVDGYWHVPHFEKMLYDQAQLAVAYLEAFQITREPLFEEVARDILDYVRRDMTAAGGGFFSAEDADSGGGAVFPKKEAGVTHATGSSRRSILCLVKNGDRLSPRQRLGSFRFSLWRFAGRQCSRRQRSAGRV